MIWIDKQVLDSFNANHYPRLKKFFTITAHVYFLVALLYLPPMLLAITQKKWALAAQLTLMGGGGTIIGAILKAIIKRPRPHNLITYLGKADSAFPSSHTLIATGLAILCTTMLPAGYLLFFCIAILVGLGRMYIQMHYLTDVIGGAIIGGILATIVIYFL